LAAFFLVAFFAPFAGAFFAAFFLATVHPPLQRVLDEPRAAGFNVA
jgi:predicted PurR-regulated permease PerM